MPCTEAVLQYCCIQKKNFIPFSLHPGWSYLGLVDKSLSLSSRLQVFPLACAGNDKVCTHLLCRTYLLRRIYVSLYWVLLSKAKWRWSKEKGQGKYFLLPPKLALWLSGGRWQASYEALHKVWNKALIPSILQCSLQVQSQLSEKLEFQMVG